MSDLQKVVAEGDHRKSLIALRDHLAGELIVAEGRDKAPLVRELRAVLAEIDAIPTLREGSVVDSLATEHADELAAARAKRGAAGL